MQCGRAGQARAFRKSPDQKKQTRRKEQDEVKNYKGPAADETFHFAPESKKHVHLDREPKQSRGRMDKRIGGELPKFPTLPDERTIESEMSQDAGASDEARHDRCEDMKGDEQRRDVNRMPAHPCHRLVVIRGGDSEHAFN